MQKDLSHKRDAISVMYSQKYQCNHDDFEANLLTSFVLLQVSSHMCSRMFIAVVSRLRLWWLASSSCQQAECTQQQALG